MKVSKKAELLILPILLLALIFYGYLSIFKYLSYNAYALDLGLFSQVSWLISHLKTPFSTLINRNQLGDHFSPVYILLSLPYRLFNSPVYLLLIQIFSVVLGGVPIYLIARKKLGNVLLAYFLTAAYFLQIGLVSAMNFDFHLATLSVGFISWTLYFWYLGRPRLYLLFLLLSLLVKEDVSILFISFSLLLFLKRQIKLAVVTFFLSAFYYSLYTNIIIPNLLGQPYYLNKVLSLSSVLDGRAVKVKTVVKTLGQNMGLSLLDPIGWFFIVPNFLSRFLSPAENRWSVDWHYGANIAAPTFFSVIFGLGRVGRRRLRFILCFCVLLSTTITGWPFKPNYVTSWGLVKEANKVVRAIPPTYSVSAQDVFVPHSSNRERIYLFPNNPGADLIILSPEFPSWPLSKDELKQKINDLIRNTNYSYEKSGGIYVFRLGAR